MALKIISALMVIAILAYIMSMNVHAEGGDESVYPTITLYFSDGKHANITGKIWSGTVFPIIIGVIKSYNWEKKIKYLFFDKSLKGLNPYGLDFVRAMEEYTYDDYQNNFTKIVNGALKETANLDSDGDGYTNSQELNAGTYPGDPNDHPGKKVTEGIEKYTGYIILGVLIISVFILYFVFGREKE